MNSRLALGTVQFGLPYGIANRQVSRDNAASILDCAWAAGIDTLDTASAYGESERRLGDIGVGQWRVISKLPVQENGADIANWARESALDSLDRLGIPRLEGLLLHRSQQLLGTHGDALYRALSELKDQGKVGRIGVSIYDPEELEGLWPRFRLDVVQVPFNVLDRRVQASGWLDRMHDAGTGVHVRSAFLQGLLLMSADARPVKFNRWQSLWDTWSAWLAEAGITPLQACLSFVLSNPTVERVVVGVESLAHLQQILAAARSATTMPPDALISEDMDLINPSRWNAH